MRRMWDGLVFVFALLFLLAGCATQDHLKPPKPEECFKGPPPEDRYKFPPDLPQKYMNTELADKAFDLTAPDATMKKSGGLGAMNNMRAGGGN